MDNLIILIFALGIIFTVVEFVDMFKTRMKRQEKGMWIILFLIASVLTAFTWFVVRRKR